MSANFRVNLIELRDRIREKAREVEAINGNEEDLRERIEQELRIHAWNRLNVPTPRYEYRVDLGTYAKSYGRIDALYGLTIFEYKVPRTLRRTHKRDEAIRKLKEEYIPGLLEENWVKEQLALAKARGLSPRILGIIIDGYNVVFVEYSPETKRYTVDPEIGSYDLDEDVLRKVIRAVIASYKKKLDARVLAADFGYESSTAKRAVKVFYRKLSSPKSGRTNVLFNEWVRLVSQAYPISGEELKEIAIHYGFSRAELGSIDGVKLFYAIQTYYSLILKLLAVEVASRFYDSSVITFTEQLRGVISDPDELKRWLELLEDGTAYSWYGIKNFLEGEFFSWYLDEWDEDIYYVVKEIISELANYDVEMLTLDLSAARDMFKLLYEELVPRKEVRQKLGIYTTPDWLAELVLKQMGISPEEFLKLKEKGVDPFNLKFLDPGVGTGTFLTIIIQMLGKYLRQLYGESIPANVAREALFKVTKNVVGFDIDTIAILTARTCYLISLATVGLLQHKHGLEIELPVYMANSVITAEEMGSKILIRQIPGATLDGVKISTTVNDFLIPKRLVVEGIIMTILSDLKDYLSSEASPDIVVEEIATKYELTKGEAYALRDYLYSILFKLEKKKGLGKVLIPIIRSHILSSIFKGYFDFIVGNPPWLAYRYIASPEYQKVVKALIKDYYKLVLDEHLMTHMEMATLFLVRCADLYLNPKGSRMIGFVMPRAIFSADQHDRFRRGEIARVNLDVLMIIDLKDVSPLFYVPACAVIARRAS